MTESKQPTIGKFIDPLTDWGFRHLFGQEPNKEILKEFLNDLFQGEKHIADLEYAPNEHDGDNETDKRVIFDLHCRGDNGEYFVVEMQRIRQDFFKDRALFYVSRLIHRLLKKGRESNDYRLPEVYLIGILEFSIDANEDQRYLHDIALMEKNTGKLFYDKLGFKFLELCNFVKKGDDLLADMDKWMYLLKHMSTLDKVPTFLDKRVFQLIFKISEVAKLRKEERMAYEASLKAKWDTQNAFDSVKRETSEQFVKNLIGKFGFTDEQAADAAEVSIDFVRKIRSALQKKK
ncbi:Rpn family recombination-promoting nuclease/putative transposase [Parapedobacter tibetensis]|uniref:Rpn family recombination-promoting nuclease/putative transposase n=1 Tax=Parapedobacter tibetensis TaxID=2972951 RepID=UPI00214DEA96|nr:Rpn family recombination-promoting nuclease/putative transposase [Parapedobacter tibetensis]